MVMPRWRSRALESITRSCSSSCAAKVPVARSNLSTSVVLPWSTWAMMARLRMARGMILIRKEKRRALYATCMALCRVASSFERCSDGRLDRLGGRARIRRVANRPAHHDVVGAVREGLRDVDDALLVLRRRARGPHARHHHQQPLAEGRLDLRRFH